VRPINRSFAPPSQHRASFFPLSLHQLRGRLAVSSSFFGIFERPPHLTPPPPPPPPPSRPLRGLPIPDASHYRGSYQPTKTRLSPLDRIDEIWLTSATFAPLLPQGLFLTYIPRRHVGARFLFDEHVKRGDSACPFLNPAPEH